MRTINATFSLPSDIYTAMQAIVEKRGLSRFVSEAIRKALEGKNETLRQAYMASSKEEDKALIQEWDAISAEGWDD